MRHNSIRDRIADCLAREQSAREAAVSATDDETRDTHVMTAERCADEAWSLAEGCDEPFTPSGLWHR